MTLPTILKMFGLTVTEDDVHKLELLIPQIPGKINEWGSAINNVLQNFDRRLITLEKEQHEVNQKLDVILDILGAQNGRSESRPKSISNGHSGTSTLTE